MNTKAYDKYDIVEMRKPHACQTNRWQIIRMGMDIRIRCEHCQHIVTMTRRDFDKKLKKVLEHQSEKNDL
ncbi:DUF951 domain-containing protein [Facklamia sp. DSM 111018]|uniref:DUF951 domain-containing protein n=1 Tax=Facklamia lactis TaxID=2749967 RepID=A0ABS0LSU1_9LACT|nr:DUF951 domain-containing protein [Facklamia lactis]MBG9981288.1 DUF951 domain-containing protein [Facklamia lactis]MBG9987235.1 DUF951 domain-containing protein [Facklamia lactis]